jgi:integrase
MKLDRKAVRVLGLPAGKTDHVYWDATLPAFGLRLRATGARTFVVQYDLGGRTRKVSLGSPAQLDPGAAREAARSILAKVRLGQDPAAEKQDARVRLAETVGAILPRYLERKRAEVRPSTYRETERYLLTYGRSLHGQPIAGITRRHVALWLSEIAAANGPAAANKARGALGALYTWALREGLVETSPVVATNKATENGSRDRVLGDAELAAIWGATEELGAYGRIVRLLLLTGLRRQEIGGLLLEEVDLGQALIRLPPERTKTGQAHDVPLMPVALQLLEEQLHKIGSGPAVFGRTAAGWQNWSTMKRELDARLGSAVAKWTLHDLRRTVSTVLNDRLHIEPYVVEAILGHAGHYRSGTAGVYNRAVYLDQRRRALSLWGEYLMARVEGRATSIVPLRA